MIGPATVAALTYAGHVARPVLTAPQAMLMVAASAATLLAWVLLLAATKPYIVRWAKIRRFRAELSDLL